jgi:hypothetical protein
MQMRPASTKSAVGSQIAKLHTGPQYKRTEAAHGKKVANRQAIAVAYKQTGLSRRK